MYLRYTKAELVSMFLGILTWTSLSTFMLIAKNAIGINNIPIFETLIFLAGIIAIRVSYSKKNWDYGLVVVINITIETIFLISLMYLLYFGTLAEAGIAVYSIIIINVITNKLKGVAGRDIEDIQLTSLHYKSYLRKIRKLSDNLVYIAGAIGTSIALIFITYIKMDIITFTKIMIVLNVIQNIYDYHIWYKYLFKENKKR